MTAAGGDASTVNGAGDVAIAVLVVTVTRPEAAPGGTSAFTFVASVVVFSLINHRFLNATNLSLLIQQAAVLATLAIGQTMIILTAGIDLSVGAAAILAQMVMAQTAANNGVPGVLGKIGQVFYRFGPPGEL